METKFYLKRFLKAKLEMKSLTETAKDNQLPLKIIDYSSDFRKQSFAMVIDYPKWQLIISCTYLNKYFITASGNRVPKMVIDYFESFFKSQVVTISNNRLSFVVIDYLKWIFEK